MSEHVGIGLSFSRRGVPLTELNIKSPLSGRRSMKALNAAPTACFLLLTSTTSRKKAGAKQSERTASHGETSATARRRQGAGRQLREVISPSSPAEISAAVVIVAFVVREGRADLGELHAGPQCH